METDDKPDAMSIDEIEAQPIPKPAKPTTKYAVPTGVGRTGWSLGRSKYHSRRDDTEDFEDGAVIGAKVVR